MAETYSAGDAMRVASENDHRVWAHATSSVTAERRYSSDNFFPVKHKPKFALDRSQPIFTIGSCFAREVEGVLGLLGVPLTLRGHGIPWKYYESWKLADDGSNAAHGESLYRGAFNKYCVHSMTHELRNLLGGRSAPERGLLELQEGKWWDSHASGLRLLPKTVALENRAALERGMATIREAKVVLMTLGMTESWIDLETGLAMNSNPGAVFLKRNSQRFQFVNYDARDIYAELVEFIDLVRSECNPDMRFVLTVSPVPLGVTFQSRDIVVENTNSKSILRVVADEIYRKLDYVDYFPSYEIVTNSPRALAWANDQLHVCFDMIQFVMQRFRQSYFTDSREIS